MFKFVHAADIHLDSPLRGLQDYPGAPVERLRAATRRAFDRVIDLCLEERVEFLIIAGDLFDTDVRDFQSALAAAAQLRRLHQAGIPVYLVLGNHDSREEVTRHVPWPANVTVFDHKRPQTVRHPSLPVAVHGMSYPKRDVTSNLVPLYPVPVPECFNIGILHTNACDSSRHAAYAPCSVEELAAKGYDYWALGHVHDFGILHHQPAVVYSGNTQGRHAREVGPKGCLLITVDEDTGSGEAPRIELRETDLVRWFHESIALQPADDEGALLQAAERRLQEVMARCGGRLAAVRLTFTGRCAAHARLAGDLRREQLQADLRALASDFSDDVWIEKITFETQSLLDIPALRLRQDLIGQLLCDIEALVDAPQPLAELSEVKDLASKVAAELAHADDGGDIFNLTDPVRQAGWLRVAETLLLSHVVSDNEAQS